jgi:hypothetical protein
MASQSNRKKEKEKIGEEQEDWLKGTMEEWKSKREAGYQKCKDGFVAMIDSLRNRVSQAEWDKDNAESQLAFWMNLEKEWTDNGTFGPHFSDNKEDQNPKGDGKVPSGPEVSNHGNETDLKRKAKPRTKKAEQQETIKLPDPNMTSHNTLKRSEINVSSDSESLSKKAKIGKEPKKVHVSALKKAPLDVNASSKRVEHNRKLAKAWGSPEKPPRKQKEKKKKPMVIQDGKQQKKKFVVGMGGKVGKRDGLLTGKKKRYFSDSDTDN